MKKKREREPKKQQGDVVDKQGTKQTHKKINSRFRNIEFQS
jgi:hypothetical protein